jgi:hypothetical protein
MAISKQAMNLWQSSTHDIRKRIEKEWADFDRKHNPSIASALYPNLRTEAQRRAEEEDKG